LSPPRTLKRRLKDWGLTRRKAAGTPTNLETISDLFQTTTADDDTIAHALAVEGTAVSTRQVKEARLTNNWRRRDRQPQQQEERQATAVAIAGLLRDSERNYGRQYLTTALRLQGHRARHHHVAAELQQQDPDSSAHRQPGKGLRQRRVEFINPGPDHLWCIDGHDKLKAWGLALTNHFHQLFGDFDIYFEPTATRPNILTRLTTCNQAAFFVIHYSPSLAYSISLQITPLTHPLFGFLQFTVQLGAFSI
jgi:hypothetical protein